MIERRYRRSLWLSLVLLLMSAAAMAADQCQHLTATGNPEYPPYLWRDPDNPGQLIGANADLLKQVASELGLEIEVRYTGPWSRAQEEVRTGRIDLLAGYFLTDARQQSMDFIEPAFLHTPSVVWVRRHGGFAYSGWEDLKGRKGGTLVSNSHGQQFDDYARDNLNLEAVPSATQAFQKLLLKRNDYVIYEQYPGMALRRTLGMEDQLKVLDPPVSSEGLYLALSHDSPCNRPELRARLAQKMREIVAGPLPEQWVTENLERWKSQQEPR
ncbi:MULTISPECIES: substrate-binding periplasmic protein [unclassified Pseudomonas]|uniref:substrate-binding periplasmic protein n=1 Tax=unclassified Pseudomonas TaxID=196821 RepID=UPI0021C821DD|nr:MULTISPECIES: transporter substrate-binding domain-containing protein [unclassified Pseudomonas]MCU1733463.1 transporter substrate-binding domain-containing protein [Pseudomonas sp. 20P_3.2_Bac4]MCU1744333.1 transporter substrate-binding domain-containing protein [Pseudomonas sp. 20P_3.2_Bac5]